MYKIPVSRPSITTLECEYAADAVASGWVSSTGDYVERFEAAWAAFVGAKHAVAVCSGTAALRLGLLALGYRDGYQLQVPALTFAATAAACLQVGCKIEFVDCSDSSWLPCFGHTSGRSIMNVSMFGAVPYRDGGSIIDAAQAHRRYFHNHSDALITCYSTYGNKILTTGTGGVVCTDDRAIAERLRRLAWHSEHPTQKFVQTEPGWSERMSNTNAAIGCAQLERADEILSRRYRIRDWYRDRIPLAGPVDAQLPWFAVVETEAHKRDQIAARMAEQGIETRPMFPCVADMPPYQHCPRVGDLSVTRRIAASNLCLPLWPDMTRDEVHAVCAAYEEASVS